MKRLFSFLIVVFFLFNPTTVFGEEIKEEDFGLIEVIPINGNGIVDIKVTKEKREMTVNHEVKGSDVYIECIVNDFSFMKEKAGKNHVDGEGHIHLFVDGQQVDSIYQAAFIVKGLPNGKHVIKLELVQNDHDPYGISEEFTVEIPS